MNIRRLSITTCVAALVSMTLVSGADAATRTWTGTNSGLWSDAGNWGGTAPSAGDDLVFRTGATTLVTTNDFAAGTSSTRSASAIFTPSTGTGSCSSLACNSPPASRRAPS